MKTSRLAAVAVIGLLFLPLLFVQAQNPAEHKLGETVQQWHKAFDLPLRKVEDRRRAMDAMLDLCESLRDVELTCQNRGLIDPDHEVRFKAVRCLARIGPRARGATRSLLEVTKKDNVPDVRIAAIAAIGNIYWDGANAGLIGPNEVVASLIHSMKHDEDTIVRRNACYVFRMIGPIAKDAASALLEVMKEKEDREMRHTAARSLSSVVSPDSKKIVPVLLEMHKRGDDDPYIEGTILALLGKIGDQEDVVIPLLIEALRNPKRLDLRGFAVGGLKSLGPKAKAAVPALVDALDVSPIKDVSYSRALRTGVLSALAAIGSDAKAAIPAIRKLAEDPKMDGSTRRHAAEVIESLQKPTK